MASLANNTIADTYPLLLKVDSNGIDGTLRAVEGGEGTDTALKVSTGAIQVDNIKIDGNTISSTDTDGNIVLSPNGSGVVTANITGNITGNVTGNVSGTAPAGTLTGSTLASGVTASSLTSVGTLSSLTLDGDLSVPQKIIHVGDTDTYLSFGDDSLDIVTGGTTGQTIDHGVLYNYTDLVIAEYIKHDGDTDNYIQFGTDTLTISKPVTFADDVTINVNNKFLKGRHSIGGGGIIDLIGISDANWVVLGESGYGLKSKTGNTLDDGGGNATFGGCVLTGSGGHFTKVASSSGDDPATTILTFTVTCGNNGSWFPLVWRVMACGTIVNASGIGSYEGTWRAMSFGGSFGSIANIQETKDSFEVTCSGTSNVLTVTVTYDVEGAYWDAASRGVVASIDVLNYSSITSIT